MNILVLIAGVQDPKWPISPTLAMDDGAVADRLIMSPFDEAALEMALRIRDAVPEARIAVRVAGGTAAQKIARAAAAFGMSDIATVAVEHVWDQAALASAMVPLCHAADIILVGREFGDLDDGLVPPLLANLLRAAYFGRAQAIDLSHGVTFLRELGEESQAFTPSGPALVSVTNDRRTRLRKPLMKNVMMARQAQIGETRAVVATRAELAYAGYAPADASRSRTQCTILAGSTQAQASALADLLWEARA